MLGRLRTVTRTTEVSSAHPLMDVIERIRSVADKPEVSLGSILEAAGQAGVLPLIFVPALIAATPLSGIPGVSMVCGILIALFSVELILGMKEFYLPGRLKRKTIDGDKLDHAMARITPVMEWIERHTGQRLSFLFHRPLMWVPQGICLLSGMAMPFLEFIPFSGSIAATGVCLLVMAMLTRDGLVFLLAMLPYAVGAGLLARFLL
ncbi:Exopolysaccharide synthesis, ExoD [Roseovarius sp. THAF9]|uniref:exopolysaccharide biosynthesis protein n=1 Tax=Roseovarius sp. THAF9 TaxID=2587847 RepID=UPI00126818B0|nr:exopolysaccharide biosynthesis protein [Roseovarius sp. THAF9]QFT92362.1 Exopolysaccharide synthesis, ExoD [Roseovarius sp. THAF9]